MKRPDLYHLLATALPILILAGWIASLQHRSTGTEVRFRIEGFDPRDMVSGHFLRYRIDFGREMCATGSKVKLCACLDVKTPPELTTASWVGRCSSKPNACESIEGTCVGNRFTTSMDRYYFDERYQSQLAVVPPEATIAVSLDHNGGGIVTALFVGDEPLTTWLEKQASTP